jgi:cyanate lyase
MYALRRKNLTYRQLGALTGITDTYLIAVFNGHKKITPRVIEQVKKHLDVDLTMFL